MDYVVLRIAYRREKHCIRPQTKLIGLFRKRIATIIDRCSPDQSVFKTECMAEPVGDRFQNTPLPDVIFQDRCRLREALLFSDCSLLQLFYFSIGTLKRSGVITACEQVLYIIETLCKALFFIWVYIEALLIAGGKISYSLCLKMTRTLVFGSSSIDRNKEARKFSLTVTGSTKRVQTRYFGEYRQKKLDTTTLKP